MIGTGREVRMRQAQRVLLPIANGTDFPILVAIDAKVVAAGALFEFDTHILPTVCSLDVTATVRISRCSGATQVNLVHRHRHPHDVAVGYLQFLDQKVHWLLGGNHDP